MARLTCVSFSADSRTLAVGDWDGCVFLYDLRSPAAPSEGAAAPPAAWAYACGLRPGEPLVDSPSHLVQPTLLAWFPDADRSHVLLVYRGAHNAVSVYDRANSRLAADGRMVRCRRIR
jgi:hypothetical protein